MFTFNGLSDHLIVHEGFRGPTVRACQRYEREAGILGDSAKGKQTPQVEAVHGAFHLVTCLAHDDQTHGVEQALSFWRTKLTHSQGQYRNGSGDTVRRTSLITPPDPEGPRFGRKLVELIDAFAANPAAGSEICEAVSIWRRCPLAQVSYPDRTDEYRLQFKVGDDPLRIRSMAPADDRPSVIARIPWQTIRRLGAFVAASREQSKKFGIEIDQETAWRALEPPLEPDEETAASLAGDAAALDNQDQHSNPIPESNNRKHRQEGKASQASSSSGPGDDSQHHWSISDEHELDSADRGCA